MRLFIFHNQTELPQNNVTKLPNNLKKSGIINTETRRWGDIYDK